MWQKISILPAIIHMKLTDFFEELKNDERGIANTVTTVLLILVGVLAVAAIWALLGDYIQNDLWPRITGADDAIQTP